MAELVSREQAHAWDLRGAMAGRWEVVVRLDGADLERIRGTVEKVAVTGAFAMLKPAGEEELIHVPCVAILSVRRPHFSEPLDQVRRPKGRPRFPGQLELPGLEEG